mgnify:FL=1
MAWDFDGPPMHGPGARRYYREHYPAGFLAAAFPGYPDAAYQCLLRLEPRDHTPGTPLTLAPTCGEGDRSVMKQQDDDLFLLSTGRELYAHRHIIGMRPGDKTLYAGYDGALSWYTCGNSDPLPPELTVAERTEIADYMIALWQAWRTRAQEEKSSTPPKPVKVLG